jgi:hypothetical protein
MKLIFAIFASLLVATVYSACSDHKLCSTCVADTNCSYCNFTGIGICGDSCEYIGNVSITTCPALCVLANSYAPASPRFVFGATVKTWSTAGVNTEAFFGKACKTLLSNVFNASAVNCSAPAPSCPAPSDACLESIAKFFAAFSCSNCDEAATDANIGNFTKICNDDCDALFTACPVPTNVSCDTLASFRVAGPTRDVFCQQSAVCTKVSNVATYNKDPNPCVAPTPTGATKTGNAYTIVLSVVTLLVVALI